MYVHTRLGRRDTKSSNCVKKDLLYRNKIINIVRHGT